VVGTHLHDGDFLIEASFFALLGSASLVLDDFSLATLRSILVLQSQTYRVSASLILEASILSSQSLVLSIGVPVVVTLVVSVVFVEGVVQVSVEPTDLGHLSEEDGSLNQFIGSGLESLAKRVDFFVEVGVDDLIGQVVVDLTLVEIVLGSQGAIGVE
jgi:hypothetical protein